MHHRILAALRRLRQDLATRLDEAAVHDACRHAGHRWRDCLLTPVAILRWFVVQVLHGNTALTHVSLLAGRSFTDAAFCQARARLPLAVYRAVLRGLTEALAPDTRTQGTWRGHRTFLVDGSSFSMPDTPELRAHFGTSGRAKPGCSFPVARILALFHAGTGTAAGGPRRPAAGPRDGGRRRRPPPPRPGRRPGGGPRLLLVPAPGDARRPRRPCGVPGPRPADRRLHAAPAARRPRRRGGGQGPPAVALAAAARRARPGGRVVQAEPAAGVAGRGASSRPCPRR